MPSKKKVEKNLVNIHIRQKDHERLKSLRYGNEPIYSNFRRVLDVYFQDKAELELEKSLITEQLFRWRERALRAEAKLKTGQLIIQ